MNVSQFPLSAQTKVFVNQALSESQEAVDLIETFMRKSVPPKSPSADFPAPFTPMRDDLHGCCCLGFVKFEWMSCLQNFD